MNKQKGIASMAVMIVMLVMAVALPVTTKLVQQTQENRSKAASMPMPTSCSTTADNGNRICVGNELKICRPALAPATGMTWGVSKTCSQYYGCNSTILDCNQCVPGVTKKCVPGNKISTCSASGIFDGTAVSCPSGEECINDACTKTSTSTPTCASNGGTCTDLQTCITSGRTKIDGVTGCTSSQICCQSNVDAKCASYKGSCNIGLPTNLTNNGIQYKWTCNGYGSGKSITCYADVTDQTTSPTPTKAVAVPTASCTAAYTCASYGYKQTAVDSSCSVTYPGNGCGGTLTCYQCLTAATPTLKATATPTLAPACGTLSGQSKGFNNGQTECYASSVLACSSLNESGFTMTNASGRCNTGICCTKKATATPTTKPVATATPTLTPACGTLSGQSKGFNNGQTECYASSSIACSSLNESGFTMANASGRCNTGICCTKKATVTPTLKATATPTLKPAANCVTTCPVGKVTAENCLGIKSSPVNMNTNNLSCALRTCYTCDLSKPADGSWCDYSSDGTGVYGCKSGISATNDFESPTGFTWKCNTSSCSLTKCTPVGNTRCNGDYVQVCRSSGLWENTVCVGGEKCITNSANKGVCGGPCTVGDKRCSWNSSQTLQILQTCTNASGTWATDLSCEVGKSCVVATDKKSGMCVNACTAGQTQCSGNSLQTCTSNGTWGTASPCGSNKVCTSNGINSASCIDGPSGCSIGTLRCFNNLLQQCDTNGTWSKQLADCSSTNKKCVVFNNGGSGTCESITTSCTPNVKKCSGGNVLQTCNSAGNAWIDTDCGFDKTCTPSGTNNASCVVNTGTGGGTDSCSRCNTSLASRGDGNCDGKINELDFSVWLSEFQKGTKSKADFNCNGSVGIEDFSIWNTNFR